MLKYFMFLFFSLRYAKYGISAFLKCHMDPAYQPPEGMMDDLEFKWLAALQYIHIQSGTPHYFRVPRVVLITRKFVLSTAHDAATVPDGYALGNIVFPDYERDETECGVDNESQLCDPGLLYVPIEDVLLHPEYKNFGSKNSVALLKLLMPIKSRYMVPVCLPLRDYVEKNTNVSTPELPGLQYYQVDFIRPVPRDFRSEEKEITYVHVLREDDCEHLKVGNETIPYNRVVCSTACGVNSGSPTIIHEHTGHWTLVALTQDSTPCTDPLIAPRVVYPSTHRLIYPYLAWITRAITGFDMVKDDRDDPFGLVPLSLYMTRGGPLRDDDENDAWSGRWWMAGPRCYDRGTSAEELFRFYHEVFRVRPQKRTNLTYYLEIEAAYKTIVVCVKLGVDYVASKPRVFGLDSSVVKLWLPILGIKTSYRFQVEAWGRRYDEEKDIPKHMGEV